MTVKYRPIPKELGLTPRQKRVLRRVEFWQQTLVPLGLIHWRPSVSFMDEVDGQERSLATCITSTHYDSVTFQFRQDYVKDASNDDLDETIIHEWLHVLFRDYNHAISSVYDVLSPALAEQWDEQMNHELEGVIERLARTLRELHSQ